MCEGKTQVCVTAPSSVYKAHLHIIVFKLYCLSFLIIFKVLFY